MENRQYIIPIRIIIAKSVIDEWRDLGLSCWRILNIQLHAKPVRQRRKVRMNALCSHSKDDMFSSISFILITLNHQAYYSKHCGTWKSVGDRLREV